MADETVGEVVPLRPAEQGAVNAPEASQEAPAQKKNDWFTAAVNRARQMMSGRKGEEAFKEASGKAEDLVEKGYLKAAADEMTAAKEEHDKNLEQEEKQENPLAA